MKCWILQIFFWRTKTPINLPNVDILRVLFEGRNVLPNLDFINGTNTPIKRGFYQGISFEGPT